MKGVSIRIFRTIFILSFLVLCFSDKTNASYTDNELVMWNFVDLSVPLKFIDKKLFLKETFSPRFKDELSDMDIILLRTTLNYKVNNGAVLTVGHDWFKVFNSSIPHENRLLQQVAFKNRIGKSKLFFTQQSRLEERFLLGENLITRLRYKPGFELLLTKSLTLDFGDEIFINLNNSELRDSGLEQNRIYINLRKQINRSVTVGLGYQLQHFLQDRDLINHQIVTRLSFDL
jgi:hypothetical protein